MVMIVLIDSFFEPVFSFDLWLTWSLSRPEWHSQASLWSAWLFLIITLRTDSIAPWSPWETWWSLWMTTICESLRHSEWNHSWHFDLLPAIESEHLNDLIDLTHRSLDEKVVWKPYESCLMLIWIAESWNLDDLEMLRTWSYRPDLVDDRRLDDIVVLVNDLCNELLWLLYDFFDLAWASLYLHRTWIPETKNDLWKGWVPNTEAWTNLVRTSEGLWWVPTFSSDMTPSFTENILNPQMLELDMFWLPWSAQTWGHCFACRWICLECDFHILGKNRWF